MRVRGPGNGRLPMDARIRQQILVSRQVCDRTALLLFGDGLRVDAIAPREHSQALLTMLHRSTDHLCRFGAPVQNQAHGTSFHACEKNAPSSPVD